eukprot:2634453-Pyramimonas_sp.AAC.1
MLETPEAPESAPESGGVVPKETTTLDLSGLHEPWGTPFRAKGTVPDFSTVRYKVDVWNGCVECSGNIVVGPSVS